MGDSVAGSVWGGECGGGREGGDIVWGIVFGGVGHCVGSVCRTFVCRGHGAQCATRAVHCTHWGSGCLCILGKGNEARCPLAHEHHTLCLGHKVHRVAPC